MAINTNGKKAATAEKPSKIGGAATWADDRLGLAGLAKKNLRKVFPDHWSFMLGEIALWSFVVLLLTGVFLTLWFNPSMGGVLCTTCRMPGSASPAPETVTLLGAQQYARAAWYAGSTGLGSILATLGGLAAASRLL